MRLIEKSGANQEKPDSIIIEIDREKDGRIIIDSLLHVALGLNEILRMRVGKGLDETPEGLPTALEVGIAASELSSYLGIEVEYPHRLHQVLRGEEYQISELELSMSSAQALLRQMSPEFR